jgi:hypothetical protein
MGHDTGYGEIPTTNTGQEEPEFRSLQDATVSYSRAAAEYRQMLDSLVVTWQSWLHNFLKLSQPDYVVIHKVIESMDDFLNHRSRK